MVLFHTVASLADQLSHEGSRLKKRAAIASAIAAAEAASPATPAAGLFAQYLAGLPFSEADPRKLNAGGALLTRAVLTVTRATDAALTAAYRRHGDLGAAAFDLLPSDDRAPVLTLQDLCSTFSGIAATRVTAQRAALVDALLARATPIEAKYLIKLMLGDMRIGVKQSLVEEAIAVAAEVPVADLRHALMLEADLAQVTRRAFDRTLDQARMRLFHPLGFMLASPVDTPEEAVARFTAKPEKLPKPKKPRRSAKSESEVEVEEEIEAIDLTTAEPGPVEAFLEDKFDGMRAQIHCGDPEQPGRVALYSRNREDITESFPELAEAFASVKPDVDGPMILDGEILGWDFAAQKALPFAILGTRIGRKKVSNEVRRQVPAVFMVFDLLYAKGELQIQHPLRVRRNRLEAIVEQMIDRVTSPFETDPNARGPQHVMFLGEPGAGVPRLMLSPARLVESAVDIDRAYNEARARSNEGVMLKAAASEYLPGRRGLAWVKLKRELATLDVVITGAEYGHGRRATLLSDYTFAVRGPSGDLLNVGKAYSGVTDAEILTLTDQLKAATLVDQGHFRTVEPAIILEVAFNNIMRSTRHASGFALRFPRILRIRTDKPLAEIDTLERVEQVYLSQVDRPEEPVQ